MTPKTILILGLFAVSCASNDDHVKTSKILSEMKSPIIVITMVGNEFTADITVKDSTGRVEILHDTALRHLNRGDTIK